MKPKLFLLALSWLALLAAAPAEAPSPAVLVECERAFAADVESSGIRAGFLKWLSPKGVVFQPGPQNGQKAYSAARPGPARLGWQPEFAAISEAGDLGWTTGPWAWRADRGRKDEAWGEYLSLWRRGGDGRYLAVLDVGISHGRPARPAAEPSFLAPAPAPRTGRGPLDKRRALWKADADFGQLARQGGVAVALDRFAAERVLMLREGLPRIEGRAAAIDSARAREGSAALMSLAQFLSESGDLGYTYGSYVTGDVANPDSAWYVNVWHRGTARPWEIVVQLVHPVPRPKR